MMICSFSLSYAERIDVLWWDKGSEFSVKATAFSTDGKYVFLATSQRISSENQNNVQVWDVNTGNFISSILVSVEPELIDVSSDGDRLLIAGTLDDRPHCEIVDLGNMGSIKIFSLLSKSVYDIGSVSFIKESDHIAVSFSGDTEGIRLYDSNQGSLTDILNYKDQNVEFVNFSPDGSFAAVYRSYNKLDILDLKKSEYVKTMEFNSILTDAAFSFDNAMIAVSHSNIDSDDPVKCFNIETEKLIGQWNSLIDDKKLLFSGDNDHIVVGSKNEGKIEVISINGKGSFNITSKIRGKSLSSSEEGGLLAGCDNRNYLNIWDLMSQSTRHSLRKNDPFNSHSKALSICVTNNETVLSGGDDGWLNMRDIKDGSLLKRLKAHSSSVAAIAVDSIGLIAVTASSDDTVKLWNAVNLEFIDSYYAGCGRLECVAISPDGYTIATAGKENGINIYDLALGEKYRLENKWENVQSLDFSNDSQYLISGSKDKMVKLFTKNESGYFLLKDSILADSTENPYLAGVKTVKFLNDEKDFVSAGGDHKVKLWSVDPIRFTRSYVDSSGWKSTINDVCLSSGNDFLFTGDAFGILKIFDLESGDLEYSFMDLINVSYYDFKVNDLSISEDGSNIAAAFNDGSIILFSIMTTSNYPPANQYQYEFTVFPNPVKDIINLEYATKSDKNVYILIYDHSGRKLVERNEYFENNKVLSINIEDMAKGVYFLKFITSNGVEIHKFIKY